MFLHKIYCDIRNNLFFLYIYLLVYYTINVETSRKIWLSFFIFIFILNKAIKFKFDLLRMRSLFDRLY